MLYSWPHDVAARLTFTFTANKPGRALALPEMAGDTELHQAVKDGSLELVEELLLRRLDPDVRGEGQMSPLHYAVQSGHQAVVRMLLRHAADPNLRNISGFTALHIASSLASHTASHTMVAILLDWGADPRIKDNRGLQPRQHARPDRELEHLLTPAEGAWNWRCTRSSYGRPVQDRFACCGQVRFINHQIQSSCSNCIAVPKIGMRYFC